MVNCSFGSSSKPAGLARLPETTTSRGEWGDGWDKRRTSREKLERRSSWKSDREKSKGGGGQHQAHKQQQQNKGLYISQNKQLGLLENEGKWEEMLEYAKGKSSTFNDVNWATLFCKCGRLKDKAEEVRNNETFKGLLSDFEAKVGAEGLEWIGIRELANAINGLSCIDSQSTFILDLVSASAASDRITTEGKIEHVESIKRAMAKAGYKSEAFEDYDPEGKEGRRKQSLTIDDKEQDAEARTMYIEQNKRLGFFVNSSDWKGMIEYAESKVETFNHVNWATLFSKLGRMKRDSAAITSNETFIRLNATLNEKFETRGLGWMGVRELSNLMHSLAVMNHKSADLFERVASEGAERVVSEGNPQEISNVGWSFAKAKIAAPVFFGLVETTEVIEKMRTRGNAQNMSNLLWAYAQTGNDATKFVSLMESDDVVGMIASKGNTAEVRVPRFRSPIHLVTYIGRSGMH